jgi:hypothetical protein
MAQPRSSTTDLAAFQEALEAQKVQVLAGMPICCTDLTTRRGFSNELSGLQMLTL